MTHDEARRRAAIEKLHADTRLTIGDLDGVQLPVVTETDTVGEGIEIVQGVLPDIDGVEFVHVVSVDFSDLESRDEKLPPRKKKTAKRGTQ